MSANKLVNKPTECRWCEGGRCPITCNESGWFVLCGFCGSRGPLCKTEERAVEAWNNPQLAKEVARLRTELDEANRLVDRLESSHSNHKKELGDMNQDHHKLSMQIQRLKADNAELVVALEKISNDNEFSHTLKNGKAEFVRKVWYVEYAKEVLSRHRDHIGDVNKKIGEERERGMK